MAQKAPFFLITEPELEAQMKNWVTLARFEPVYI